MRTNDAVGAAKNPSALGKPPTAAAAAKPKTTVAVAATALDADVGLDVGCCCGRRGSAPAPADDFVWTDATWTPLCPVVVFIGSSRYGVDGGQDGCRR